jgi:multidrug efflux pump subunit AcrA (membrane-fusion protein)
MISAVNRPYLPDLRKPPWLTAGAVVVLASGLVAVGDSPAVGVSQATVLRGNVTATASAAGTVQSADTRELVFGTSGTVTEVEVAPGDKVRSGQVLARLDDTDAKGQVEVAKAAVAAADDAYTKAEDGICTGAGGAGGSGGSASGGSASGGGSGNASAEAADYRSPHVPGKGPRTPTPTPRPSRTPTPTPTPTRTTPTPTPTTPPPTPPPTPRPTGRPKPTAQPKPTGRPGQGRGTGGTGGSGRSGAGGSGRGGGSVCPANAVEVAQANVTEAEVKEREAERTLDATKITAPVNGTVLSVSGAVGQQVPGQSQTPFLTLGDLSDLQIQAMFPLGEVNQLKLGQPTSINLGMLAGHTYRGSVTRIDPAATTDGNRALFGVMISLDDQPPSGLRTGMSATVEVTTAEAEDTLYVPAGAVHASPDGTQTVLVRRDGRTLVRTVHTGVRGDRFVAVTGGLTIGDRVVMPTTTGEDGYPTPTFPGT